MPFDLRVLSLLAAAPLTLIPDTASIAQTDLKEAPRVTSTQRYSGGVRLNRKVAIAAEAASSTNVEIRNWQIGGGVKMDNLSSDQNGMMIVQLRAGELTTIIGGVRKERGVGEFWTVPEGVKMGIETEDDTANIKTITISNN